MKYGYFDDGNREYVITNPKTPVKWINYVGTLTFGGIVYHTGGALICKGDPALNRITKYIPQLPSLEFKGTTLYLRLKQGDGYKVCEPYVYPQNILGDEHPQFGLARNSWLSGTASWAYQTGTQYILGVRPTYEGFQISPCIPRTWDGFKVTREFRKAVYQIEVKNPDHVCKGVRSVQVDDKEIVGNVVPVFGDGRTYQVEVIMGEEVRER
jgi:cellobiose phosphorylase